MSNRVSFCETTDDFFSSCANSKRPQRKHCVAPINAMMDHGVWRFVRGNDKLEITREDLDDGTTLIIAGDGTPRSYFFREAHRLEMFQRDMETLLLKTGWTFHSYDPDRRSGRDRRGWPRRSNDRRRWWTDGITKRNRESETYEPAIREPHPSRTGEK